MLDRALDFLRVLAPKNLALHVDTLLNLMLWIVSGLIV